jgi:hypothetical protein
LIFSNSPFIHSTCVFHLINITPKGLFLPWLLEGKASDRPKKKLTFPYSWNFFPCPITCKIVRWWWPLCINHIWPSLVYYVIFITWNPLANAEAAWMFHILSTIWGDKTSWSHKFKFQRFKGRKKHLVGYLLATSCILQCGDQHQAYIAQLVIWNLRLLCKWFLGWKWLLAHVTDITIHPPTPIAVASTNQCLTTSKIVCKLVSLAPSIIRILNPVYNTSC